MILAVDHEKEPPAAMRIPLDEISFSTRSMSSQMNENDADDDGESIVSDMSEEELPPNKVVDSVPPRSIFSTYYNANPTSIASKRSANPPTKRIQRLVPLQQQNDPDPYKYFGIERPERQRPKDDSDSSSSLNTYERILQMHEKPPLLKNAPENRPFWMSFFGKQASEPHLATRLPHQRNACSDTVLIQKPKKSCLRRGRFSCHEPNKGNSYSAKAISFQPKIEVRVFEPPVEQFASKGWSDMFG